MNDRRWVIALVLFVAILFLPQWYLRRFGPAPKPPVAATTHDSTAAAPGVTTPAAASPTVSRADSAVPSAAVVREDTVIIRSPLYRYAVSTKGGRIVSARLLHYASLVETEHRDTLELLPTGEGILGGLLLTGADTIRLDNVAFTASADSLSAVTAPATLTLHGTSGNYTIDLTYVFSQSDYRVGVTGHVTGIGAGGGTLLVGLGNGMRNTETNAADNYAQSGVVTKFEKTALTKFGSLKAQQTSTVSGPFEWVAVKSKYFVWSLFAYDSTSQGVHGNIGGVQSYTSDTLKTPFRAHVVASISVPASGAMGWTMYIGPMEYDRLTRMGRDFDDVNPYGWSWIRWLVRPIAVWIRAIFVWMHQSLGLGYGLVIVVFGIMVRVLLWPLSRIAMRSMARMQALQPQLTALQDRFKDDPAQIQKETFKLYKEHDVNPFGGCWPMLIPYPLLIAVFFVLAYTIEVRGVHFLWMTDLARADPLYVIPILMAASMYAVSRIGQMGLPPNPQTKMMTWMMPIMMLVFFARFAAGLNLYYTIQNIASIPQQWLVMQERKKLKTAPVVVGTKRKS